MIRYSLKCSQNHCFESWFASSAAYESLHAAGHVTCPVCDDKAVEKALMAPQVASGDSPRPAAPPDASPPKPPALQPDPRAEVIARLRAEIERTSDYVGLRFADEARKMHEGIAPERAIHGEASAEDARALLADGVPVAPLPFLPRRKTN